MGDLSRQDAVDRPGIASATNFDRPVFQGFQRCSEYGEAEDF